MPHGMRGMILSVLLALLAVATATATATAAPFLPKLVVSRGGNCTSSRLCAFGRPIAAARGVLLVGDIFPRGTPAVFTAGSDGSSSSTWRRRELACPPPGDPDKLAHSCGMGVAMAGNGERAVLGGFDATGAAVGWVFERRPRRPQPQDHQDYEYEFTSKLFNHTTGKGMFGFVSVAMNWNGTLTALGQPLDANGAGCVLVFARNDAGWTQAAKLVGANHTFGKEFKQVGMGMTVAMTLDGTTVAFGGPYDNDLVGSVWIFSAEETPKSRWAQQVQLFASNPTLNPGFKLNNPFFGKTLAFSGDGKTLAVGAPQDGLIGATYVFSRNNCARTWRAVGAKLVGANAVWSKSYPAYQGWGMALSRTGRVLVVTAPGDFANRGATYVFARVSPTSYVQTQVKVKSYAGQVVTMLDGAGDDFVVAGNGNVVVFAQ